VQVGDGLLVSDGTVSATPASIGAAAASHTHSASDVTSGTLAVARGGTGLSASPSLLTNLASTTAANVLQASPRPGVTGVLPVANGGTGASTAAEAAKNLTLDILGQPSSSIAQDADLNSFTEPGVYIFTRGSSPNLSNSPTNYDFVMTVRMINASIRRQQMYQFNGGRFERLVSNTEEELTKWSQNIFDTNMIVASGIIGVETVKWIKYKNGSFIVTGYFTTDTIDITNQSGSIYFTNQQFFTLPFAVSSASSSFGIMNSSWQWMQTCGMSSTTQFRYRVFSPKSESSQNCQIAVLIVGTY
jgi:hypothetical protein